MTAFDPSRFKLGQGRPRPPFRPKVIRCTQCGAAVDVKDERAVMAVCPQCSAQLELSREEVALLRSSQAGRYSFPIPLGKSIRYQGVRYEVIARMAFIEDGDPSELTRQYLLYNPYRGTWWLDEYRGEYSRSWTTHLKPVEDVRPPSAYAYQGPLETGDGARWRYEEHGEYELVYVDGTLPWVATVGDRVEYVEFAEIGGSRRYEIQRTGNEVEFALSEPFHLPVGPLSSQDTREGEEALSGATARPDAGGVAPEDEEIKDLGRSFKPSFSRSLLTSPKTTIVALIALAINLLVFLVAVLSGKTVVNMDITATQLVEGVMTPPFGMSPRGGVFEVRSTLLGNNHDIAFRVAVSKLSGEQNDLLLQPTIPAAHESLFSWRRLADGKTKTREYIRVETSGPYQLKVSVASAQDVVLPEDPTAPILNVRVIKESMAPDPAFVGTLISALVYLVLLVFVPSEEIDARPDGRSVGRESLERKTTHTVKGWAPLVWFGMSLLTYGTVKATITSRGAVDMASQYHSVRTGSAGYGGCSGGYGSSRSFSGGGFGGGK